MPEVSTSQIGNERFLVFTYQQPKNTTDLEYVMKVSSDLVNWYSGDEHTETIFRINRDPNETTIARELTPFNDEERRFARLRVRRR